MVSVKCLVNINGSLAVVVAHEDDDEVFELLAGVDHIEPAEPVFYSPVCENEIGPSDHRAPIQHYLDKPK